jgi:predicted HTH domain antitoxin
MNKLILHPTDMSQWHALVNEAQSSVKLALDEEMESYLVFLLMRFAQSTKLIESVLALDLLESMHILGNRQIDLLRDYGHPKQNQNRHE